jgi:hypothetical protein
MHNQLTGNLGVNDFNFDDIQFLRQEAIDLYERALTDQDVAPMLQFLQKHLAQNPPPVQLFREMSDELHQRLIALREQYFETRNRLLHKIKLRYDVDLTPLVAPPPEMFLQLPIDEWANIICAQKPLDKDGEAKLRKLLKASHNISAQVFNDVQITETLHQYIVDWLMALGAENARATGDDSDSKRKLVQ